MSLVLIGINSFGSSNLKSDDYEISYEIKENVLYINVFSWDHKLSRKKSREMMKELFVSNGILSESGWNENTEPKIVGEKGYWTTGSNKRRYFQNRLLVRFKDFDNEQIGFKSFKDKEWDLVDSKEKENNDKKEIDDPIRSFLFWFFEDWTWLDWTLLVIPFLFTYFGIDKWKRK